MARAACLVFSNNLATKYNRTVSSVSEDKVLIGIQAQLHIHVGQAETRPAILNLAKSTNALPTSTRLGGGSIHVDLRYVADRDVIAAEALAKYFEVAAQEPCETLEAYADMVLNDLNNELVPRWIWLRLRSGGHQVIQQDQQPSWDNHGLLNSVNFS